LQYSPLSTSGGIIDEYLKKQGHDVLRLPPYHCEFNPIELILGDIKGFVSRQNSTFKQNDVKELIHKGFAQVNELKWQKACNHVKNVVEPKLWKEDRITEEIPKLIININSDSETEVEMMRVKVMGMKQKNMSGFNFGW
jgi:2C-methyl-D-erythritol 2,4-cyclodiphosphate synthase